MGTCFLDHRPAPPPQNVIFSLFLEKNAFQNKKIFFLFIVLILSILPTKKDNRGVYNHLNSCRVQRGQAPLKKYGRLFFLFEKNCQFLEE